MIIRVELYKFYIISVKNLVSLLWLIKIIIHLLRLCNETMNFSCFSDYIYCKKIKMF